MTIAALELNDQSLLIQAEDGALHAEPGYARLTEDGIVTGEEARAVAWREPQYLYNQYWSQLSQAPLPIRHRFARHHADIAFAQLRKLWQHAGSPPRLLLLVPGSFTTEQLSLLLGMVEALPARTAAVIDSALAACSGVSGDTLFVDLQMHDSVFTVCRPAGDTIRIEEQEVFPGLGMGQIQNSVARHISDQLIEGYRFDPLHSSEAEQAIYDQIPHWLTKLRWEEDVSTRIKSPSGEHACMLNRSTIRVLIGERLASVSGFLDKWRGSRMLLSHASGLLTGLMEEFSGAEILDQTEGTQRCLSHHARILEKADGLYRLHALVDVEPAAPSPAENTEQLATHLLQGDIALPLDRPVSIRIAADGPRISSEIDDEAPLTVVRRNRSLETLRNTVEATLPSRCRPGDSIRIGEHELRLIRVGES
jgi:hypothetical protein